MRRLLTFRWILTTLLVLAGVGVLIRLGIWQLDRLEWRRAFNARVTSQLSAATLDLNLDLPVSELYDMEYRDTIVRGEYDFSQEVLLRNQVWDNRLGFHVLTPLHIDGAEWVVLVDRGWIPYEDGTPGARTKYQGPAEVEVRGMIRRGQEKPDFGGVPDPTLAPGQTRLDAWNVVNLARIEDQSRLKLLPVYIIEAPDAAWTALPYRSLPDIEISEGPHFGYAMQWFTFAAILGLGYPFFVRRQLRKSADGSRESSSDESAALNNLEETKE